MTIDHAVVTLGGVLKTKKKYSQSLLAISIYGITDDAIAIPRACALCNA
jgi:hypothetical protein